jgi:hypothetical protein
LYDLSRQATIDAKGHLFQRPRSQVLPQRPDKIDCVANEITTIDYQAIAHDPAFFPTPFAALGALQSSDAFRRERRSCGRRIKTSRSRTPASWHSQQAAGLPTAHVH